MGTLKIAVIGAGVTGLATLKSLLEEDFDVTCFQGRDSIGGVWKFTTNVDNLSVLETIVSNKSKYKNPYTNYPYPREVPAFPTAQQVQEYFQSYAQKFKLLLHIRLNTKVTPVIRNAADTRWTDRLRDHDDSESAIDLTK